MKAAINTLLISLILATSAFSQGTPETVWSIQASTGSINAVSVSSDGSTILSSDVHTVKIWDRATHTLLNNYEDQSESFISSTISADGNLFTAGYIVGVYPNPNVGVSTIFDMHSNTAMYTIPGCFTTFSNDNKIIAGTGGGVYRDVNANLTVNGSQLFEEYTGNYNNDVAISPGGDHVAVATSGNVIKIYDSQNGTLIQTISGHTNDVRTIAFSPDGSLIASGAGGWDPSGESSLKIWNAITGSLITTLEGHEYWVDCVAFSSDGDYLISAGRDGLYPDINPKIILWNTADWSMETYYDEGLGNSATSLCTIPGTNQYLFGNTNGELTLAQLPAVIPAELTSFTATSEENSVTLLWETATETNNSGFEIIRYKQNDKKGWERVEFVEGHGTTNEEHSYSFVDKDLTEGKYQYMLKQIDYNGTYEFSNIVEAEILTSLEFSLEQNYPNPFNPDTRIKYSVPGSDFVMLKVYDALGNEVAALVNEVKPVGSYEIEFNASSLPSGIYFYRIQAGSFLATKKMILLK